MLRLTALPVGDDRITVLDAGRGWEAQVVITSVGGSRRENTIVHCGRQEAPDIIVHSQAIGIVFVRAEGSIRGEVPRCVRSLDVLEQGHAALGKLGCVEPSRIAVRSAESVNGIRHHHLIGSRNGIDHVRVVVHRAGSVPHEYAAYVVSIEIGFAGYGVCH